MLFAGDKALGLIRDGGLSPASVRTILGAAGGPKWLVLYGLDRAIFFSWLSGPAVPVDLVGSSIGAWRFAAVAQGRRAPDAHETLREAYTGQTYETKPSAGKVSDEAMRIMHAYLPADGIDEIFRNPSFRLAIISMRGKGAFGSTHRRRTAVGMLLAGTANAASRKNLGRFFVRTIFADGRDGGRPHASAAFVGDPIGTSEVHLTRDNIRKAILASGSIPVVMEGVRDIPGAPPGVYWDGGLVDYHVTIPDSSVDGREGIVLFPHYIDRIIPGWFDKHLPWRGKAPTGQERMLLICPSREFVGRLPYGKIPDRTDFKRFFGNDKERVAFWKKTAAESERLGDEFLELVGSGRIRQRIRPLSLLGT